MPADGSACPCGACAYRARRYSEIIGPIVSAASSTRKCPHPGSSPSVEDGIDLVQALAHGRRVRAGRPRPRGSAPGRRRERARRAPRRPAAASAASPSATRDEPLGTVAVRVRLGVRVEHPAARRSCTSAPARTPHARSPWPRSARGSRVRYRRRARRGPARRRPQERHRSCLPPAAPARRRGGRRRPASRRRATLPPEPWATTATARYRGARAAHGSRRRGQRGRERAVGRSRAAGSRQVGRDDPEPRRQQRQEVAPLPRRRREPVHQHHGRSLALVVERDRPHRGLEGDCRAAGATSVIAGDPRAIASTTRTTRVISSTSCTRTTSTRCAAHHATTPAVPSTRSAGSSTPVRRPMNRLRDAPTITGTPSSSNESISRSSARLWSTSLPNPMPGSTQRRSRSIPAAAALDAVGEEVADLRHHVVVARVVLHRLGLAEHVHQHEPRAHGRRRPRTSPDRRPP